MSAWASAVAALLLAAQPAVLFRFQDPGIVESSDLVVSGDLYYTANDSGDSARVFAVDGSGRTVGVTTYGAAVVDVEALALGPGHTMWAGDIGDNDAVRSHVTVYEFPEPGRGDHAVTPTAYDLVYQDGPRDAETLLVHPRTGRLYVVSKGLLGGTIYAAPKRLRSDRTNVLVPVGPAGGLVTDGAFFPDGEHVVLRDYGGATILATPTFAALGSFPLPEQQQGEGIALVGDRVVVSSEGVHAPVKTKAIPARLLRLMNPAPTPSPSPTATPTPAQPTPHEAAGAWGGNVVPYALGAGWLALLVLGVRAFRRRSRYRR